MTAAAAAEKKKKKDEMYYRFNTSRGMGYWKSRMRNYDDAAVLFTTAVENAEPGLETPLLIARSKAYSKLVNHEEARTDALAVIDKFPEDIGGLENDAYTLYEKDDFEDSLVRNYRGLRKRKKPDYFYKGILVGKETIEDCIGRTAGPCMDHNRLGHIIVDMHMKPHWCSFGATDLEVAKRKNEKERIDRFFAQKYLGHLAADKQFLQEFLSMPDLKSGNKEHNRQLEILLTQRIEKLNRQQETLMTQRPMYMLKHHEPKFSNRYKAQKKKDEESWRKGVTKVIDKLQNDAKTLQKERKIEACLDVCERLRRFLACQPTSLMSDKMKDLALDQMYQTIGTLYMDMKTFVPQWSEADNDLRIEFMLCSLVDNPRFLDRVRQTYFPKIWNVKEMKTCLESRLSVSTNKVERTFLYHEIARCLIEEGSIEKAYKAASTGYKMFKDSDKALWCFNNGFLTATVMLMEGNTEDARMAFTDAVINARKLDRNDCAFFMQRVIKIATEPNRLDFEGTDPKEKREKDIVNMMSTSELRGKAYAIMQRVVGAPPQAKLQLTPSSTLKPVSQGNSRRSLKVSTKAKRRTLFDVKNSRHNNTQQHWVPSNTELPNID